jgi:hypothetical protein
LICIDLVFKSAKGNIMGYYIEGPAKNKGVFLEKAYGAEECSQVEAFVHIEDTNKIGICVVNNGPFEAAALCYSDDEFMRFSNPKDLRPKKWYLMDRAKACELAGYY